MPNDFKSAESRLYNKGFYLSNMVYDSNEYELYNKDGKVVIDHLSEAQVIDLSKIL